MQLIFIDHMGTDVLITVGLLSTEFDQSFISSSTLKKRVCNLPPLRKNGQNLSQNFFFHKICQCWTFFRFCRDRAKLTRIKFRFKKWQKIVSNFSCVDWSMDGAVTFGQMTKMTKTSAATNFHRAPKCEK